MKVLYIYYMEIYKDIPGFENIYQVSDLGNVRSLDRQVRSHKDKTRTIKGKQYSPYTGLRGYKVVTLRKGKEVKVVYIHKLIAQLFIPNPLNKICINHKDGDKLNNSIDNLEWATYKENNNHARDTGLWRGKHKMS